VRIDDDLLDVMATWDQAASAENQPKQAAKAGGALANWSMMSGNVQRQQPESTALSRTCPRAYRRAAAAIRAHRRQEGRRRHPRRGGGRLLFRDRVRTVQGGADGRGVSMLLAELKSGERSRRGARFRRQAQRHCDDEKRRGAAQAGEEDFVELLREPLLHRVSAEEARDKIARGAQWIDVRYPSEFQYDKLPGAINIPLSEIRKRLRRPGQGKEYVLYCQSEPSQRRGGVSHGPAGYRAFVLGGAFGARPRPVRPHPGGPLGAVLLENPGRRRVTGGRCDERPATRVERW